MGFEEESEREPWSHEVEAAMLQIVLNVAPRFLAALETAKTETEIFATLPRAATSAFHLGRFADARSNACRALEMAPAFAQTWSYGNAIHYGHTVLGLLALREGEHSMALRELDASGRTPGSPQLDSFGPTMHLAKELLKLGYIAPVIAYFEQCRVFWTRGTKWLGLWESVIRAGRVPNFFQHSHA